IRELPLHAFANLRPQRVDSAFFDTKGAAEFLVDDGQRVLLHALHGERELGRLAGECWVGKLGRERHRNGAVLARHGALEPLFELRPRLARADDDRDILAVTALERLTADAARVV